MTTVLTRSVLPSFFVTKELKSSNSCESRYESVHHLELLSRSTVEILTVLRQAFVTTSLLQSFSLSRERGKAESAGSHNEFMVRMQQLEQTKCKTSASITDLRKCKDQDATSVVFVSGVSRRILFHPNWEVVTAENARPK